jgi:ABC-type Zn uptake system ZnuABC Zn-binding protein ZnuA
MEPYYSRKDADFVASRTGATVLVLPPSVGGLRDRKLDNYVDLLSHNIQQIAATVK